MSSVDDYPGGCYKSRSREGVTIKEDAHQIAALIALPLQRIWRKIHSFELHYIARNYNVKNIEDINIQDLFLYLDRYLRLSREVILKDFKDSLKGLAIN